MSRNMVLALILALGLGVVFFIAGSSDAAEPSDAFYQWTLPNGDVMMTDDVKRIPVKYRDIAVERSFAQVGKDAKVTEVTIPAADYAASLEQSLDRARKTAERTVVVASEEPCDGPVTVTQERHERTPRATSWTGSNTYNSMFYVMRDSCGNVKSVTLTNPVPVLNVIAD